jgi:hypothetical protein
MNVFYLYVKQHNITKLKYFGFTTKRNPFKYKGSGLYWKRHLRKYGNNFSTIEIWGFDTIELCKYFAIKFSADHSIIESKEWANLKTEDAGNGGFLCEESRRKIGESNKNKLKNRTYEEIHGVEKAKILKTIRSKGAKGKDNQGIKNPMFGKKHKETSRKKMSEADKSYQHNSKWITNGVENKKVYSQQELDHYFSLGFFVGRTMAKGVSSPYYGKVIMNKEGNNYYVNPEEIEIHLSSGYSIGRVSKLRSN